MAVRMIPVYECDKCEFSTEDPTEIKYISGMIYTGDKSYSFINASDNETMVCNNCLLDLLEIKIDEPIIIKEEIIIEKKENPNIIEHIPRIVPQEIPQEIPKEEIKLDIKESGEILLLCRIDNEGQEEAYATLNGFKNAEELRTNYSGSLLGLYVKTGEHYIDVIPENLPQSTVKSVDIINKIIFGVPNIITIKIQTSHEGTIGYIKLSDFDYHIDKITDKVVAHKFNNPKKEIFSSPILKPEEIIENIFDDNTDTSYDNLDSIINASFNDDVKKPIIRNYRNNYNDSDDI